ncbi:LD-carboxypeptidase [Mucilaginibacter sp. HC2]|uniref:S66 peptidase family protein n=1 Tax=Mucilaginibacter inviolabilis TaxID=2714892 RepID=UPI00140C4EEA|nr:LD-carboxypeptidase [Mucilaginibacter inviolabilis]NHA07725.1 LD-carboxypeptidase [Mucilaginibacter inviolabilis]
MDKPVNAVSSGLLPPYLKKGDKIAITCPAKKLPRPMNDAVALLQSWGLEVVLGDTVSASYHQFAGDDDLRAHDLQRFINDDSIKAIIAARGGYGTIRMIDKVDFSHFAQNPKWLIGFSDITVLHTHLFANYGAQTIHGQMPVNIPDASKHSLDTLRMALFGETLNYNYHAHGLNRSGEGSGILVGGNLSLLISVSGSVSDIDYSGKILFIEDVGEYLYSVDRMLRNLKRAGKLAQLAGLVVGGFTDMKDNDIPFGQTVPEIVMDIVREYDYPVCFDFPAGHIPDNCSLIFGKEARLAVHGQEVSLKFV